MVCYFCFIYFEWRFWQACFCCFISCFFIVFGLPVFVLCLLYLLMFLADYFVLLLIFGLAAVLLYLLCCWLGLPLLSFACYLCVLL